MYTTDNDVLKFYISQLFFFFKSFSALSIFMQYHDIYIIHECGYNKSLQLFSLDSLVPWLIVGKQIIIAGNFQQGTIKVHWMKNLCKFSTKLNVHSRNNYCKLLKTSSAF